VKPDRDALLAKIKELRELVDEPDASQAELLAKLGEIRKLLSAGLDPVAEAMLDILERAMRGEKRFDA
jgi:uncharacterized coiled-coil DUF342 family protein